MCAGVDADRNMNHLAAGLPGLPKMSAAASFLFSAEQVMSLFRIRTARGSDGCQATCPVSAGKKCMVTINTPHTVVKIGPRKVR